MAIDQYGQTFHNLGAHPRKELLKRLGRSKAAPIYVDTKDGKTLKIGWIIGGLWLTIYKVERMEIPQ
jgi:hypothetical protein